MRWTEIIVERHLAYLYHGTNADEAAKIIHQNKIADFTSHPYQRLGYRFGETRDNYVRGVSLTRDPSFAGKFKNGQVTFVLDQVKLKSRFKFRPIDYYMTVNPASVAAGKRDFRARSEAEEFCLSAIEPLDRFLVEIRMPRALYDDCVADNAEYDDPEDTRYWWLTEHPLLKLT